MMALPQEAAMGDIKAVKTMLWFGQIAHAKVSQAVAVDEAKSAEPSDFSWDDEKEKLYQELAAAVDKLESDDNDCH